MATDQRAWGVADLRDVPRERQLWDLKFGCASSPRFMSTALSVFLDELAHRARHIELAGEPRRGSHFVRGDASLPVSLSTRAG